MPIDYTNIDPLYPTTLNEPAEDESNKPKEPIKKQAKVIIPPVKYYWDVKVECLVPATIIYKVFAETPEQASKMIKSASPNGVQYKFGARIDKKLAVYQSGSNLLKWVKNLLR